MQKIISSAFIITAVLGLPATAQTTGNTGLCNRIVQNCSKPDETGTPYGGYGTFEACWADQGAPYCPPQETQPDVPISPGRYDAPTCADYPNCGEVW